MGELIASRLPNSLLLAAVTALFSVPIALTLGISAAVWRGSWFDRAASTGAVAVVSVPEFLVATLAVLIFAVQLKWLPALSYLSSIESLGQLLRAFAMPVHDAHLRDRGADDAHDTRRRDRPARGAVHRDGAAEGRLAAAHRARARAAERGRADRQRGRA